METAQLIVEECLGRYSHKSRDLTEPEEACIGLKVNPLLAPLVLKIY